MMPSDSDSRKTTAGTTNSNEHKDGKDKAGQTREERLAAALRANLRRRKQKPSTPSGER